METGTTNKNEYLDARMVDSCQRVRPALCADLVKCGLLTMDQIWDASVQYRLGSSRDGGSVFWRIDSQGNVHDGRIAYHTPDCRLDKGRPLCWVSGKLKVNGSLAADWQRSDCLFGEHLLRNMRAGGSIVIIESELSALVFSVLFPDLVWLATGEGISVSVDSLVRLHRVTNGAAMVLLPHTDLGGETFRRWEETAITASVKNMKPIYVWNGLERITDDQKAESMDLLAWVRNIRIRNNARNAIQTQ